MILSIPEELKSYFGNNIFESIFLSDGKVFREHKNRKTLFFEKNGKGFFLKIHRGIGIKEIFKNLMNFRLPVISVMNEIKAINMISRLGIDTMKIVGYGIRGIPPAWVDSFLITEELKNTMSLEKFCADWKDEKPDFRIKCSIIYKVADISRNLHKNGVNHRDFYICHFLLDLKSIEDRDYKNLKLYLIDLHRVQIRKKTPERWIIKDLSGLLFSCMDIGLSKNDIFRFMKCYSNKSLRDILKDDSRFWYKVYKKAVKLYVKHYNKLPEIHVTLNLF